MFFLMHQKFQQQDWEQHSKSRFADAPDLYHLSDENVARGASFLLNYLNYFRTVKGIRRALKREVSPTPYNIFLLTLKNENTTHHIHARIHSDVLSYKFC